MASITMAACLGLVLVCLLAITLQIFLFSPISPYSLEFPPSSSADFPPPNTRLQNVIKLGEGFLKKPESVCFDKAGTLYTATRDGWIKRLHRNGTWEDWKMLDGRDSLLGLTVTEAGDVIVCDADKGLLKVSEDRVSVLASHVNGAKLGLVDDVIAGEDGSLYFSDASSKFGHHNWYLDVLEAKPHGKLLKYDPSLNETLVLLDELCFPNGVTLSADKDYLVFCETWKFQCLKYWLKGESKGQTEILVDNLPGGPDNINLAPDGSFWIALIELRSKGLEFVHTSKFAKHLVASFPRLSKVVGGMYKKATVVKVRKDGKIMKRFDDPNGKVMTFVTSAVEFEDHLYLGNLNCDFIGKLQLN